MNSLPELKGFLQDQADEFNLEVVFPGGDPYLILLDGVRQVVRYKLSQFSRDELVALLSELGIERFGKIPKVKAIVNDMG